MRTVALVLAAQLAAGPASAGLARIGGAGAVRGSVNAMEPGATVGRVIESGKPLYLNDHVATKADSRLQVMLLDESVFTLGPDSDMVLDEFVYDPETGAGKVAARLTQGVFRFVTGKVARNNPGKMSIKVPTGTIGIRGTKAAVEVKPDDTLVILEGAGKNNTAHETPGALEVSTGRGGSQMLTREGFGSHLPAGGVASAPANLITDLARLNLGLTPKPAANAAPPAAAAGGGAKSDAVQQTGGVIAALTSLTDTHTTQQQSNTTTQTTTQAQQQSAATSVPDGLTTWDFIRSQLTTGTGVYSIAGAPMSCTGCAGSATLDLHLTLNFGAQTAGDTSNDYIKFHNIFALGDTNTKTLVTGGSFASVTGSAIMGSGYPVNLQFSSFTCSVGACNLNENGSGQIQNAGGVVAKNIVVNDSFSATTPTAVSGSVSNLVVPRP